MKTTSVKKTLYLFIFINIIYSCIKNTEIEVIEPIENPSKINLKYFEGSFDMDNDKVLTGLIMSLSFLGAELPAYLIDSAINIQSSEMILTLDTEKVGFSKSAQEAIKKIIEVIRLSEGYQEHGFIDLGRFIMLTINSSYHYYEITGAPKSLNDFLSSYDFNERKVAIINSSVSNVERIAEFSNYDDASDIAFITTEVSGSIADGTYEPIEYETAEVMPNGQFRFALYDINGRLKTAADPSITNAGKPAKCLWCHEISIQIFFRPDPVFDGENYLSEEEFINLINEQLSLLDVYRSNLSSVVDFSKKQDHSLMEYLYLDFMEPTLERLALEWNISPLEAEALLEGIPTHIQFEYGFENVYYRKDVDHLNPVPTIEVPSSSRELSAYEPDFF